MNAKEKTIWYLVMNTKDLIAINYQDRKGNWRDNQMKNYYYTLKNICFEIACRDQKRQDIKNLEEELDTDIEALEESIRKDIENA